ncbi:Uncharacterised protein [Burkholderia cenocepacia]|nr:Uncharacterised protein [Burkholderia cenocepacia]
MPYGVQNAGATACPLIDRPSLASASATLFAVMLVLPESLLPFSFASIEKKPLFLSVYVKRARPERAVALSSVVMPFARRTL